jgi:type IV pilus assembly protein PilQ
MIFRHFFRVWGILLTIIICSLIYSPKLLSQQKLISNVFYETDLRQAIQDIASQAEVNIMADNTVQGFVTMELVDLPLEQALKRILSVGGYTFKKLDGYYLVGAAEPSNPSFSLLSVTESIPISYIPAKTAAELLSEYFKPYIKANEVANSIVVSGSPEIIESIRQHLKSIDKPSQQVMIRASIVEVKDNALKSVGIDWSILGQKGNKQYNGNINLSVGLIDTLSALFSLIRSETGIPLAGTPVDLITRLQALVTDGKATIYLAKEQYFSVVTGPVNYPYTRLEQVAVGIKLDIIPYISENNEITVKIAPEVSDAVGSGREGLPLVDRRSVNTTVRVKDGETIVIGGLTQENTQKTQNKIPLLGSIPILGYLFSHTKYEKQKTDIVVFVTPTIIKENQEMKQ